MKRRQYIIKYLWNLSCGTTKKEAETNAAKDALKKLNKG
ncbi:putative dsRNA-binding protein [Mycoplasmopsis cynos]|nr:putative dsRNA-binding protein [Mycoplasmopsis cynos]UWV81237.1 putative dsRNA-binding protein [Mycoplasmopsis cynos]